MISFNICNILADKSTSIYRRTHTPIYELYRGVWKFWTFAIAREVLAYLLYARTAALHAVAHLLTVSDSDCLMTDWLTVRCWSVSLANTQPRCCGVTERVMAIRLMMMMVNAICHYAHVILPTFRACTMHGQATVDIRFIYDHWKTKIWLPWGIGGFVWTLKICRLIR